MPLRVLTNSEAKTHRRCAREHRYAYGLGYRSAKEEQDARYFGTLIHVALEAWWKAPVDKLDAALATLPPETDPFERARAQEMLRGYTVRWENEPLELIAAEVEFRAPLINPETGYPSKTFELGGKLDGLVRHTRTGATWIIEHKTSGDDLSPGSDYWQALQLDSQVSTYYVGARALGYEVSGCLYDVLGKTKLRPFQISQRRGEPERSDEYAARIREHIAQNPDRYYVRGAVVRLDTEEQDAGFDVWQTARLIAEGDRLQRFPRNADACRRFNRLCPFFGVCTGTASLSDPALYRRTERVHEEFGRPTTATAAAAVRGTLKGKLMDTRQTELPFQTHSPTSQAAAEAAAPEAPIGRERVLKALRACPGGFTDQELQRALRMDPSTERPRRIELVRMGLVKDSGHTRKTRSKRQAVVWAATPHAASRGGE